MIYRKQTVTWMNNRSGQLGVPWGTLNAQKTSRSDLAQKNHLETQAEPGFASTLHLSKQDTFVSIPVEFRLGYT